VLTRVIRAWRTLQGERRLAAVAALALFVTLFLPWYQQTVIVSDKAGVLHHLSDAVSGFGAFSFVEAAVLLVALGVLTLLFQRAEGRAFHLPGGDGWVISAAGAWTCLLVIWRIFDKNSAHITGLGAATTGVEWGIFATLGVAGLLAYSGSRIRLARIPEPPLPDDDVDFQLPPRGGRGSRSAREQRATRRPEPRGARGRAPATPAGRSTAAGAPPAPAGKARPRTEGFAFPAPEPLVDPPTLRISRNRSQPPSEEPPAPPQTSPPPGRRGRSDDQLRIPFEDR
jgi:hypothetical protein